MKGKQTREVKKDILLGLYRSYNLFDQFYAYMGKDILENCSLDFDTIVILNL